MNALFNLDKTKQSVHFWHMLPLTKQQTNITQKLKVKRLAESVNVTFFSKLNFKKHSLLTSCVFSCVSLNASRQQSSLLKKKIQGTRHSVWLTHQTGKQSTALCQDQKQDKCFAEHDDDDNDVHLLYSVNTPCYCSILGELGRAVNFEACRQWMLNVQITGHYPTI